MVQNFQVWDEGPAPSFTARQVIKELNRLGREVYSIEGPAQEFRVSRLWLDTAYFFESLKVNYEIDGPDHLKPERIKKDKRRDAFLKARGWDVIRISYKLVDEKGPTAVAKWILDDLTKRIIDVLIKNFK
ncbi:DUF559 domain-containing protein [Bacillus luti]|uniref:DUF559 domain-containing protein n=1 Tax=Bacillus luti TaxID=2026191 RepID=UPI002898E6EF|nr:DUF559 domain-containing protein [Bacillus luti]